ncbi:MAG: glycosyltransferase [Floccifex sp.]
MSISDDVSIVCCYNSIEQYCEFKESLSKQSIHPRVVGIDNTQHKYSSCSEALNFAVSTISTPYVIFSHQDIEFINNDSIEKFVDSIKAMNCNDVLGVAGRCKRGGTVVSNILHGADKKSVGKAKLTDITECEIIDECFFGGYTENFREHPFDTKICNNWHLYAVDCCLSARVRGNHIYICPISLIHKSAGKMNGIYNKQFYQLSKKYEKEINYINTTCAYASTQFPYREIAYIKRAISMALGRY